MLYTISDNDDFKNKNLQNWYENSEFWLKGNMRHLKDVHDFTGEIILDIIRKSRTDHKINLLDIGCGEGWIFRLLKELKTDVNYVGVDFNDRFIEASQKKYSDKDAIFMLHDLELPPPKQLIGFAHLAINFFNFFEIPNIENAFRGVSEMLAPGGALVVVNIDPIMQILSVSENFEDFKESLRRYEKYQTRLGYDKDIDVGDQRSGRIYKSLLYSTATYTDLAKRNGLQLFDYKEIIKTGNFVPQIYQFIFFRK